MSLETVQDYVSRSREILLDQVVPYRYPDLSLVEGLNIGILEGRRLRPDLFTAYFRTPLPSYVYTDMTPLVPIDQMYRMAFVYYMCGIAQLRDDETTQDSRAVTFLQKFATLLISI